MLIRTQDKSTIYNLDNFCNLYVYTYNEETESSVIILTYLDGKDCYLGYYNNKEDALMVMDIIEYYYSHYGNNIYHMPQEDDVPVIFN